MASHIAGLLLVGSVLSLSIFVESNILFHCREEKNNSVSCPVDQYYETDEGRCARCDELCHQAEIRGTKNKCLCLCPVDRVVKTSTVGTTQNVTRSHVTDSPRNTIRNEGAGITTVYILCSVSILVCTTTMTTAVLWTIGKRRYYGQCCGFKAYGEVKPDHL